MLNWVPTTKEVAGAILTFKNYKAPGKDAITAHSI
jgi:hypothetical protein